MRVEVMHGVNLDMLGRRVPPQTGIVALSGRDGAERRREVAQRRRLPHDLDHFFAHERERADHDRPRSAHSAKEVVVRAPKSETYLLPEFPPVKQPVAW